jgi:hypothetical protein
LIALPIPTLPQPENRSDIRKGSFAKISPW